MNLTTLPSHIRRWWRNEIRPLLILAVILFSIRSSFADWNDVPSGSMEPTILIGDRIFVDKLAYDLKVPFTTWHLAQWSNPQRGDVAVFYSPYDGTRLVKRVVGLPGDTVELQNEHLIINGRPVDYAPLNAGVSEPLPESAHARCVFATEELSEHPHVVIAIPGIPARRNYGPIQVPAGQYFMMGDNRDNSFDSRYFGTVARNRIVGKATAVVISLDHDHYWLPREHRFFCSLDSNSTVR